MISQFREPIQIKFVDEFSKYNLSHPVVDVNFEDGSDTHDNFDEGHIVTHNYQAYAMSELNRYSKFSKGYVDCIGTILSGYDSEQELPLSLLIHQFPNMGDISFSDLQRVKNIELKKCKN